MDKVILAKENGTDVSDMRTAYCDTLLELAEKDERIVALDADLMGAMGMKPFAKRFPARTVDCGIQEANMIGVACGLAVWGKIPFAHTFGPFCTRRACDQIFMSGAYNKANVKVVGSDPGITAAYNGGTHMPFEDMGIMRGIPTMTVVEPTDIVMLKDLLPQIADTYGMFYMRLVRKEVRKVYDEGSHFTIGKAAHLRDGSDVTIIASGYCVAEALDAARALRGQGWELLPVMSFAAGQDTRFGRASGWRHQLEGLTGRPVLDTLQAVEPLGPRHLADALVIAPCTGATLARLAEGLSDTPVTLAAKSLLRVGCPVVIAVSTNDGLGASGENIARLYQRKHYYFVPYGQDDPNTKPQSLKARFELLPQTLEAALEGRQLQPVLQCPCG